MHIISFIKFIVIYLIDHIRVFTTMFILIQFSLPWDKIVFYILFVIFFYCESVFQVS